MDQNEWKTFVAVVEEGNISKAAEKLFLSQPAISYRLRHMEAECKYPLLLRTNEGVSLTPEGEVVYRYCRRMIVEQDKLEQELSSIQGKIHGVLKLASSINFADYELPQLLRSFTEQYPDIRIQVKTGYSQQVHKIINSGDCMVAIARGDSKCVAERVLLHEEPYYLVYKEPVKIEDLEHIPLIWYRTDPSIARVFDDWVRGNLSESVTAAMELDSMVTCRHFVREGLGWSILPFMGLGRYRDEGLFTMPITKEDGTPYTRPTYLYYAKAMRSMRVVDVFVKYVMDYYKTQEDCK